MDPSLKFKTIDEYHGHFPKPLQDLMESVRMAIRQAAPDAVEVISYNMPAFKTKEVLVYYAANKAHIGFYPTSSPIVVFKKELEKYKTSKGAIQFPLDQPMPLKLIKDIVKYRLKESEERAAARALKKKK